MGCGSSSENSGDTTADQNTRNATTGMTPSHIDDSYDDALFQTAIPMSTAATLQQARRSDGTAAANAVRNPLPRRYQEQPQQQRQRMRQPTSVAAHSLLHTPQQQRHITATTAPGQQQQRSTSPLFVTVSKGIHDTAAASPPTEAKSVYTAGRRPIDSGSQLSSSFTSLNPLGISREGASATTNPRALSGSSSSFSYASRSSAQRIGTQPQQGSSSSTSWPKLAFDDDEDDDDDEEEEEEEVSSLSNTATYPVSEASAASRSLASSSRQTSFSAATTGLADHHDDQRPHQVEYGLGDSNSNSNSHAKNSRGTAPCVASVDEERFPCFVAQDGGGGAGKLTLTASARQTQLGEVTNEGPRSWFDEEGEDSDEDDEEEESSGEGEEDDVESASSATSSLPIAGSSYNKDDKAPM